jgi:hypothetical protein
VGFNSGACLLFPSWCFRAGTFSGGVVVAVAPRCPLLLFAVTALMVSQHPYPLCVLMAGWTDGTDVGMFTALWSMAAGSTVTVGDEEEAGKLLT